MLNTVQLMEVFPVLNSQNWMQCSRSHLMSAKERQVITAHDPAGFLLLHPRMLLAFFATKALCWILFSLWSTKTFKSFLGELLNISIPSVPSNNSCCLKPDELLCRVSHEVPLVPTA